MAAIAAASPTPAIRIDTPAVISVASIARFRENRTVNRRIISSSVWAGRASFCAPRTSSGWRERTMTKQPGSAIVVGGGSGIGRAAVLALAAAGRRVWAVGRDRARLEQLREGARKEASGPGEVRVHALDATDAPAMDRLT